MLSSVCVYLDRCPLKNYKWPLKSSLSFTRFPSIYLTNGTRPPRRARSEPLPLESMSVKSSFRSFEYMFLLFLDMLKSCQWYAPFSVFSSTWQEARQNRGETASYNSEQTVLTVNLYSFSSVSSTSIVNDCFPHSYCRLYIFIVLFFFPISSLVYPFAVSCCIDLTSSQGSIQFHHFIFDLTWWIKELVADMTSQQGPDSAVFLRYISAWMRSWLPWALWGRRMHHCRSRGIIPSLWTQWVDRPWLSSATARQVSLQLCFSILRLSVSLVLDNLIWNTHLMGPEGFKLK